MLFLVVLAFLSCAFGLDKSYPFSVCKGQTDLMAVKSVDIVPDVLKCGIMSNITITATPTVTVNKGSYLSLKVSKLGVVVIDSNFDTCSSLVGASCPIAAGTPSTLKFQLSLDFKGCIPVSGALAETKAYDEKKKQTTCVDVYVDVAAP